MRKAKLWVLVMVASLLMTSLWSCAFGNNAPRIDPETLQSWLADPQVLIVDVRQPKDWQSSGKKIKGALRLDPDDAKTWAAFIPKDKKIVLYCS
jgi:rhodanese-related sulfurtransferase